MAEFHNELHAAIAEVLANGGPVVDELDAAAEVLDLLIARGHLPPVEHPMFGYEDDRALRPRWEVLEFVLNTYRRQQEKHGGKADSLHRRSTPNLKRLRVLMEEVGEAAAELDDDERLDAMALANEVAQCAAVAIGWLEGMMEPCDHCSTCVAFGCACSLGPHITDFERN